MTQSNRLSLIGVIYSVGQCAWNICFTKISMPRTGDILPPPPPKTLGSWENVGVMMTALKPVIMRVYEKNVYFKSNDFSDNDLDIINQTSSRGLRHKKARICSQQTQACCLNEDTRKRFSFILCKAIGFTSTSLERRTLFGNTNVDKSCGVIES